jgi:hypothetical protein
MTNLLRLSAYLTPAKVPSNESNRGVGNGIWRSMTAFFELESYVIALLLPSIPSDYIFIHDIVNLLLISL